VRWALPGRAVNSLALCLTTTLHSGVKRGGLAVVTASHTTKILLVFLCVPLTGCLTMWRGNSQIVSINSTPPGASVEISPDNQKLETPTEAVLSRRRAHVLTIRKEGFETNTVVIERKFSWAVWRNVIWIHPVGWLIGLIVDVSTGAAGRLEPESLSVLLTPIASPAEVEVAPPSD
jgi:hypothetical protein